MGRVYKKEEYKNCNAVLNIVVAFLFGAIIGALGANMIFLKNVPSTNKTKKIDTELLCAQWNAVRVCQKIAAPHSKTFDLCIQLAPKIARKILEKYPSATITGWFIRRISEENIVLGAHVDMNGALFDAYLNKRGELQLVKTR